jgi:2-hydroxycyclohexanecarboxyl-CoA dehydrogenase
MDLGLTDKVVLVTGATANIGRAIVRAFASEGARIVVSGRDAVLGHQVVEEALGLGATDATWIAADLMIKEQAAELASAATAWKGGVDVLVNNAGGNATIGPFTDSDEESWRYDIDINLTSVLRLTHALLPQMIERQEGRIINIGSTAGLVGDPFLAVYSAAKAALFGFTRVLACEVGVHNITVNAIAPYATRPADPDEQRSTGSRTHPETGVFRKLTPEQGRQIGSIFRKGVLPRLVATSDEMGAAAAYLASSHAAFITGETLTIDGGVRLGWRHPDLPA